MLSTLLQHADQDPQTGKLHAQGGRAFVAMSLRPFLIAACSAATRTIPAIVVAGDDRQATRPGQQPAHLAGAARKVRYYPSRGVTYESHLSPPPHLIGQRIAALDALLDVPRRPSIGAPVVVVSAVALSRRFRTRRLTPARLHARQGRADRPRRDGIDLVAAGYERVDQVEDRGQFAIRGGLLDLFPSTEDRAIRVDLFGDEIESLRWFSTFTQRSLGDADEVEVAPAAELAVEYRELAEIAATDAPGGPPRHHRALAG